MMTRHDGDITPGMNSFYGGDEPKHTQIITQRRKWGSRGIRYDEGCERCGRVSAVDNDSGLCKRCG